MAHSSPAWVVIMPDDDTAFASPQPVLDLFQVCLELAQHLSNTAVGAAAPANAEIAAELEASASNLAFPLLVHADSARVEACGVTTAQRLADMCIQQRVNADQALLSLVLESTGSAPTPPPNTAVPVLLATAHIEPLSPQDEEPAPGRHQTQHGRSVPEQSERPTRGARQPADGSSSRASLRGALNAKPPTAAGLSSMGLTRRANMTFS